MQGIDTVGRNERDTDKRCHKASGARRASKGDEWTIIANSSAAKSHTWKRRLGSQRESNLRYIIKNRMKSLLLHNDRINIVYLPIWLSQTIRRRDAKCARCRQQKTAFLYRATTHHCVCRRLSCRPPFCLVYSSALLALPSVGKTRHKIAFVSHMYDARTRRRSWNTDGGFLLYRNKAVKTPTTNGWLPRR